MIGMGYVGTSLAVTLAARGRDVVGVDRDPRICRMLMEKKSHVYEADLELEKAIDSGKLRLRSTIPADPTIDTYIVCVGTPVDERGHPDLTHVDAVVENLAAVAADGALVILRSTVSVGTTRRITRGLLEAGGKRIDVAFCPERTVQGAAVLELQSLPQIVAGASPRARERAIELFRGLTNQTIEVDDLEAAEIAKLACNSFRYTTFAFSNELARLCESVGVSMSEVRRAATLGYGRAAIPSPGPVGGSCLPKDVRILARAFQDFAAPASTFLAEVSQVHRGVPQQIADTVLERFRKLPETGQPRLALLGVAFKGDPPTDDERSSPSVELLAQLRACLPAAIVRSHDPLVDVERQRALGYHPCATPEEAVVGAQIVILGTNHARYREISLVELTNYTNPHCVVYDVWALHLAEGGELREGVEYVAFGESWLSKYRLAGTVCGV
ncbi:nucleotide sugar dehydrogenase [Nocardia terpenica]|uniref:nucleotide sugar dehydrogenase n=1 Tax=Nocardia terpenica TaxID=455432 RepID=UPI0018938A31|nr:nucleotide sugar dehydrogenase [Nocardia terpenica]MBF6063287.1 nucleotide sugar dehydrogenase [Nocardia terpenica]MBF6105843.1 nucleotide sugar dehydrogenase [Nocardia terpenica]MBF6113573.1 nucleotide sugar dehydrogenase [Nocardia terpenica]MBF6119584.1 nucleotide sugar dehydrogenase [Nocardia terpenica]MBF6151995.1 nucleotide sugar dehydrogenase [Nocardia terpenica]